MKNNMKNMIKLLAGIAAAGIVLPASAAITLSITPASKTVGLGGLATYNLNISGLDGSADYTGPQLGAFGVQIDYNPAIASFQSATYGTGLGAGDYQSTDTSVAGQLYLSDAATVASLAGQSSSFTLATFTFQGVSLGTTPLTIDWNADTALSNTTLGDANANSLVFTANNGSLTVAPEPGLYGGLAGAAAVAVGFWMPRRKSAQASDCKA